MNILVTGANGQLGTHMRLRGCTSQHHYMFTDVDELDITNQNSVNEYVEKNAVSMIINCAAYTNVDKAEVDEDAALRLNATATRYLAESMKQCGGFLIHISTDYVFGGNLNNTPCVETEIVNPTGVYGRTKLLGEQAIAESGCHSIIIRTAWLYSEYGNNFLKTMLRVLPESDVRKVVFDQIGTPTYAGDLADAIYNIVEKGLCEGYEGVYHYSNEGVCSWYDFAKTIASLAGISRCKIVPCHSNEFPSKVVRPSYSVLDKTKIKEKFKLDVPYWIESLNTCINNLIVK